MPHIAGEVRAMVTLLWIAVAVLAFLAVERGVAAWRHFEYSERLVGRLVDLEAELLARGAVMRKADGRIAELVEENERLSEELNLALELVSDYSLKVKAARQALGDGKESLLSEQNRMLQQIAGHVGKEQPCPQ